MNDKKSFFTGICVGVISIILFNFILTSFIPFGYANLSRTPSKKIDTLLKIIDNNYIGEYDKKTLEESMYYGLINGIGDPYTTYFNEEAFENFLQQSNGTFTGIGVQVTVDSLDNRITILTPFAGSPGERAGLLPKDKITKVNGFEVHGTTLNEALGMIKGEPGTSVNITILRESTNETFNVDIIRELIEDPTVSHKILENNIGYIRITSFEEVTANQFMIAYNDLINNNIKGLIIDLRNNPGGLLHSVAKITDVLVPPGGNIVYTENKHGKVSEIKSEGQNFGKPLVILVNGNSASASEVLTGAVKDYEVGYIVGMTTFGKGIVQSLIDLNDGSGIKITTAKYFTPNGTSIHGEGITPHYVIEMSDELSVNIASLSLEEDIQLSKALEVIKSKL